MIKQLVVVLSLLTFGAQAQLSVQITNTPPTQMEAFAQTTGAVIIRGTSSIGTLAGEITFPIEIRVEELLNVQSGKKVYGAVLRTKMPTQTVINYLDYDEMDPLLAGIRFIVQADHNISGLDHYNAYFKTRSGFTVSKYSADNRNYTALKTGLPDAESNVMDLPAIAQFETLMVAAKTKLDAIKRGDR